MNTFCAPMAYLDYLVMASPWTWIFPSLLEHAVVFHTLSIWLVAVWNLVVKSSLNTV